MGKVEDIDTVISNVFRRILKEQCETMIDTEVLDVLKEINTIKYKHFFNLRHYGRYIIKQRREW